VYVREREREIERERERDKEREKERERNMASALHVNSALADALYYTPSEYVGTQFGNSCPSPVVW